MLRLAIAGLLLTTTALAQEPSVTPVRPAAALVRITGTVVTEAGLPIPGATVSLPLSSRNALTDAQGAFELTGVQAGSHTLIVNKPGLFQIGRNGKPGTRQITVLAGDNVRGVSVTLLRGGVITGRIVDDHGEPVDQLEVWTMRWGQGIDGRRALLRTGDADLTDDHGRFRLFGLAPGDYAVVAVRPNPQLASFDVVGGRLGPSELPIYSPGTPFASEAQVVTIDSGREEVVNFAWQSTRALRVSGVVISPVPLQVPQIFLSTSVMSGQPGQLGSGGTFTFEGVAPGDYVLTVRTATGGGPFASVPVTVRDTDISGLVVTMNPPATIRGRIVFEGATPRAEQFQLYMKSNDPGDVMSYVTGDVVRLREDGSFETQSGRSHIFFDTSGWTVTGVTVDGEDAYLTGIDLTGKSSIDNVRVRVTNRLTGVSGRVTSDRGEPIEDATVVLYQVDSPQAPHRMTLRTLRTDAGGRFEITNLRRGSYVAVASETADTSPADPEFQDWLRDVGQRFSLAEGQAVNLELRPVSPR